MANFGIGDPYWYEWFVGLEHVIRMLNPDSNIESVVFQAEYNTIDDVVVKYNNKVEKCFQVKHEIDTGNKRNLTFAKLIETSIKESGKSKNSLLNAIAIGWKQVSLGEKDVYTILYTNRDDGKSTCKRTFNGKEYEAVGLIDFMKEIRNQVRNNSKINDFSFVDEDLSIQWQEFKDAISLDDNDTLNFLKKFEIRTNMLSLRDLKEKLITELSSTFKCSYEVASELFGRLLAALNVWTTTLRETQEVLIEDVYTSLSLVREELNIQHILAPPLPFFSSRDKFCDKLYNTIEQTDKKICFIYGDPGSGKTSIASYLQYKYSLFDLRYHAFRPISPEQKFYDNDDELCSQDSLLNEMLVQIRRKLKGKLAKYKIPVHSGVLNNNQKREEILRLLTVLHKELKKKVVICIDGIDHAARSNKNITFLNSLFSPQEIPEGVILILIGQPVEMYSQYPIWLRNKSKGVEFIEVPKLDSQDINELLIEKSKLLRENSELIASILLNKTKGNNLSVVFAIEELNQCETLEDIENKLNCDYITDNIQIYYDHIWDHTKKIIASINLQVSYPDIIIATSILLLNGRINTQILSEAFSYINLSSRDWNQIMNNLYPLLKKKNDNEYSIFHNDFRIYLMCIIHSYNEKYEELAFMLATYFINKEEKDLLAVKSIFPLLNCANKPEEMVNVFDYKFVVNALAMGMDLDKIKEIADYCYNKVIEIKNWDKYFDLYLAIDTIKQHLNYYEYMEREYNGDSLDKINSISLYELKCSALKMENIDDYNKALDFVNLLILSDSEISRKRAIAILKIWFDNTPEKFIEELEKNSVDNVWDTNSISNIMMKWGEATVKLKIVATQLDSEVNLEVHHLREILSFYDSIFTTLIQVNQVFDFSNYLKGKIISQECITRNIKELMYTNSIKKMSALFEQLAVSSKSILIQKQSVALLIICGSFHNISNQINLESLIENEDIKYIHDDETYKMVLNSFLYSYYKCSESFEFLYEMKLQLLKGIDRKTYNCLPIEFITIFSCFIGKCEGLIDSGKSLANDDIDLFVELANDYLEREFERSFDYSQANQFILFAMLNGKTITFIDKNKLINSLKSHLFNINNIGMYYKVIILQFLKEHNYKHIIAEYINKLFGKDDMELFQHDDYESLFLQFYEYADFVEPIQTERIKNKLIWNKVGYVGHKNYALIPIHDLLKKSLLNNPSNWIEVGLDAMNISYLADIAGGNRMGEDIITEVMHAAIRDGLPSLYKLRDLDENISKTDYLIQEQLLYLAKITDNENDLMTIWLLSIGILSWYSPGDQHIMKQLYDIINSKYDFENRIQEVTPNHYRLVKEIKDINDISDLISKKETQKNYLNLNVKEMIELIESLNNTFIDGWKIIQECWEYIINKKEMTKDISYIFADAIIRIMPEYRWDSLYVVEFINDVIKWTGDYLSWNLAEKLNTLNKYKYETRSDNMFYIIKNIVKPDIDVINRYLQDLIKCHIAWLSGNNHIDLSFELDVKKESDMASSSKNIEQFALDLLLEQFNIHSIHRMEIACIGIHIMLDQKKELFDYIVTKWETYSPSIKRALINLSIYWCYNKNSKFDNFAKLLLKEYNSTNDLYEKYLLYFLLKIYYSLSEEQFEISYLSPSHEFKYEKAPLDYMFDFQAHSNFYKIVFDLNGGDNFADIFYNLDKVDKKPYVKKHIFYRDGDSREILDERRNIEQEILYKYDKEGEWDYIPAEWKAQGLLYTDDYLLLSSMPEVVQRHLDEWNIEEKLINVKNDKDKTRNLLKDLINSIIKPNEICLGAKLLYPIENKEGLILTINTLLDSDYRGYMKTPTPINYSLLINEELYEIDSYSSLLFGDIVGTQIYIYGNSFLAPREIFKDVLGWYPDNLNPYLWRNDKGNEIMRFKRMTYPYREGRRELYFRQPYVCMWVAKKELFEKDISSLFLDYKQVYDIQNMDDLTYEE